MRPVVVVFAQTEAASVLREPRCTLCGRCALPIARADDFRLFCGDLGNEVGDDGLAAPFR